MKNPRRVSILIVVVLSLVVTFAQVISVSAQGQAVPTGGLVSLATLAQIVRLMLGAAFVYTFSISS